MTDGPRLLDHRHEPVYRVVRSGWADPLDASHSRRTPDRRWNDAAFPALYCCCSEAVARAVALDVLDYAGLRLEELQPAARPELAEIAWHGSVADAATAEGVEAAGLPPEYPRHVSRHETRRLAARWHGAGGVEGVVCRSASLARLGLERWAGGHEAWSELAIFADRAARRPRLLARRTDLDWL
jgi:RES domain-containing protein